MIHINLLIGTKNLDSRYRTVRYYIDRGGSRSYWPHELGPVLMQHKESKMTLQQQLDEFMDGVRKQAPSSVLDVVDKANADLTVSGLFEKALRPGDSVPLFRLPNANGKSIDITDMLSRGPLVISFYRGAWCPFCNIELNAFQKTLPVIRKLGADFIAISPEKPDFASGLIDKQNLTFEVLSDYGNKIAQLFGIVFTLEGDLRQVSFEAFGVDLPKFNGDQSWQLPVPATFVIDKNGTVRFSFVDAEFRHRAEPEEILQVLKKLSE